MLRLTLLAFLGILLVGILLVGILWCAGLGDIRMTAPAVDPATPDPHASGDHDQLPAVATRQALERRPSPPPAPSEAPGARPVRVRGRCVDEHGIPLAGMAVELAVGPRRFGRRIATPAPRHRVAPRYTCGDGRFAAVLTVPPHHEVRVRTDRPGRASAAGSVPIGPEGTGPEGTTVDVGDICVTRGAYLSATLVDQRGHPAPDVALRLHRQDNDSAPTIAPVDWHDARSDSGGRFRTGLALAAGRWTLIPCDDVRLIEPARHVEVPPGVAELQLRIVVALPDPRAMITGTVLDAQSRPVPDIAVEARSDDDRLAGHGRSNALGRFRIVRRADTDRPVRLVIPPTAGFDPCSTGATQPWGATDVTLALVRAGDLSIKVVTADGRTPVEDFGVAWSVQDARGIWCTAGRQWAGHHVDGTAVLRAVPTGRVQVVVLPRDRTHAPNSPIEFINPPGSSTLRIVLPHRVALRLTVVDDTGGPVTDTRVQLLRSPAGRPVTIWSTVVDPGPRAGWPAGWPEGSPEGSPEGWPEKDQLADQPVEQLDTARTDAAGRATLYVHHNGDHLAIRVLGPGHAPTVFAPSVIAAAQTPMLIRVARGATLRGTVAPLDDLNRQVDPASPRPRSIQRPWVDLRALDRGVAARTIKAPIGADGAFVVQDLPPGRWEVSCRIGPSDGSRQALDPGTATIWLGAGEDRHLALQPTRRAPTSPTLPERGRTRRP